MQLLLETPGTFQVLVDMLGLSSHMASESACALCYRISLERNYRPELGGISRCLYHCFITDSLLLYYCFTTALLLGWRGARGATASVSSQKQKNYRPELG
jgi:hypothetical protein